MSASGRASGQAALSETAERLFRVDEGSDEPDDIVFLEGDEEAVYVYCDMADINLATVPKAGSEVTLKGMDTDAPEIVLPGGAALRGAWEESLGSCLFFSQAPLPHATPAAPSPAHPGGQQHPHGPRYYCHTERRLRFSALEPAPAPPRSPPQVRAGSPHPAPAAPQAGPGGAAPVQAAAHVQATPAAPQGAPAAAAQTAAGAPAAASEDRPEAGGGAFAGVASPAASRPDEECGGAEPMAEDSA